MLYPNGWCINANPYRNIGPYVSGDLLARGLGARRGQYVNPYIAKTASQPEGYGISAITAPTKAGGISGVTSATLQGTSGLNSAKTLAGTDTITLTGAGALSIVVSLEGSAVVVTFTGDNSELKLSVGLDGSGNFTFSGTSDLSMVVPFAATGNVLTMGAGATDLKGLLALDGSWSPFTELSPQNLAQAVWDSMLVDYQETGTAGKALSLASSGGIDYDLIAEAVKEAVEANGSKVDEIHRLHGLKPDEPLVVSDTSRTTGSISQSIATAGVATTVTRQ